MYHVTDIPQWAEHKLSEAEVPLTFVAENIRGGTGRFDLRQSKQAPNAWALWDVETDNVAVVTHAFIVRWTSPLDTGNYVPEGKSKPDNLTEGSRRSEPGPNVQLSVAFDCKTDDTVHRSLAVIENWAESIPRFNADKVPRSQWMTPSWIASNAKLIVSSQLFTVKTPFNSKKGLKEVPYEVHPWISDACTPKSSTWVPNPNRVLFYDAQSGVLESLSSSSEPSLQKGDLVKMTFRFVFTSGRTYWHSAIKPLQIIRVGQIASSIYGGVVHEDEPVGIDLPGPGARIILLQRQSSPASDYIDKEEPVKPLIEDNTDENSGPEDVNEEGKNDSDISELSKEDEEPEGRQGKARGKTRNSSARKPKTGSTNKRKAANEVDTNGKPKRRKT